ncbi:MAG TPA: FAD-dependent oxidoreductase [Candidatus Saccharimonadales bacterium]|nr:FAD-dependent oxidoreductase [Candidatus Saccharimonadales bacterium]
MAKIYDVAVVGAGPTGLSAAVYTTREDLETVVLDHGVIGGLIATTEIVDNYPGFPEGIGGLELSDLMRKQAERFGAEIRTGVDVAGLERSDELLTLKTNSDPVLAKSVLIATGSSYKHLEVPGETELGGRGVHYCATCDGPLYRGKRLVTVGGGNTALQETLFLAKFASHITMLVRGSEFRGAEVLVEQIQKLPNVEVKFNTSITKILAEGHKVSGVETVDNATKAKGQLETDGVFVFVGLLPNTGWLGGAVELDKRGLVKVGNDFATSLPGVYAAGDVCAGSIGQIASAVGEGVSAALSIRHYLAPHHVAK